MFKVGDLIEGKKSASEEYAMTKEGGVYKVVDLHTEYKDTLIVEIEVFPANAESKYIGPFIVHSEHFQLINLTLENE